MYQYLNILFIDDEDFINERTNNKYKQVDYKSLKDFYSKNTRFSQGQKSHSKKRELHLAVVSTSAADLVHRQFEEESLHPSIPLQEK